MNTIRLLNFYGKKFPENAIYRRKDNQKWYTVIFIVDRNKIGLDGSGKIEILDLWIDPMQLDVANYTEEQVDEVVKKAGEH